MKYLVVEIQKFDTGAMSTPAYAYDDINAAQSKYHAILSGAAVLPITICHRIWRFMSGNEQLEVMTNEQSKI